MTTYYCIKETGEVIGTHSDGLALRYTACGGLAADTLQGMKELITETIEREREK